MLLRLPAASCVALTGCGDEAKTNAGAPAADQKKAAAAAPQDKADAGVLKAAWVYPSPRADEGWSKQHDEAREIVQKKFGDKIQTQYVENVTTVADAERVIRDLASRATRSSSPRASST